MRGPGYKAVKEDAERRAAQDLTTLATIRIWCADCDTEYPLTADRWAGVKHCDACGSDAYTVGRAPGSLDDDAIAFVDWLADTLPETHADLEAQWRESVRNKEGTDA